MPRSARGAYRSSSFRCREFIATFSAGSQHWNDELRRRGKNATNEKGLGRKVLHRPGVITGRSAMGQLLRTAVRNEPTVLGARRVSEGWDGSYGKDPR